MEKEEQRFVVKFLWLKGWRSEKIHQELMKTLGHNAHTLSQIKNWLQSFRTGDLSCSDLLHVERQPLTSGPQVEACVQNYPLS
jgi:hypothetical protein